MQTVCIQKGKDPYKTTKKALKMLKFRVKNMKVLVKPNLTTTASSTSGITTDVNVCGAILESLHNCDVTIGESCRSPNATEAFKANGYFELAEEFGCTLLDFDNDLKIIKQIPNISIRLFCAIACLYYIFDWFISFSIFY